MMLERVRAEVNKIHTSEKQTDARIRAQLDLQPAVQKMDVFFKDKVDWSLINRMLNTHLAGAQQEKRVQFSAANVVYEHDQRPGRIMGYNEETKHLIVNLGSKEVQAVVSRAEDGPASSKEELYMLVYGLMHEVTHAQGYTVIHYGLEQKPVSAPVLQLLQPRELWAKRFERGIGSSEFLEYRTVMGESINIGVHQALFLFEGMTELLGLLNTKTYFTRGDLTFMGQTIKQEEVDSLMNTYISKNDGIGYKPAARTLVVIAHTLSLHAGVDLQAVFDAFQRAYASPTGLAEIIEFLHLCNIPKDLIENSMKVNPASPAAMDFEREMSSRVRLLLQRKPEVLYTILNPNIQYTYTVGPGISPKVEDKK